ncbi:tetratricopeptide repeat protein [Microbulbifer thermotolerans]|uniref:Uncharacterized protein n=1 Tax=Microbulbifer thermotolerans TaxID=252514 RepID=A0A143HPT4_MICTH|nr:hypothetical protein [Microbulbifer thermotolerans]AMX03729.1 hypothetical protein A3224_15070 [Microbulbifer thermotolerans]MCX2780667.1 hypothetical protein [Microbulbifer thermotolerans]MCX2783607.1 hypothetical protein [Microbulbifer thermotolerans]MCX2795818.1 hypothetical protein [Microbulbifer thermotolerans]MCX2806345.1 hypothetical protein [Microbulbifer thermotolerans]
MLYRPLSRVFSLTAALLAAAAPLAAEAPKKYSQAQDMAYGAVLYEYFQGNYFDALSTLLVARERDAIKVHSDNAALIEGGISLGFGLRQRAATLFEQQLQNSDGDSETDARLRRVAWQKLAELNYLQGDWPLAAEQLQKSGAASESGLELNLALRRGDFAAAEVALKAKSLSLEQRVLGNINLAAALAREGQLSAAAARYTQAAKLARRGDDSEEMRVLADKAYTGAGYAYALQEQHSEAMEAFRQVRLQTPWARRALLGLGWSAINSGQYKAAVDALQYLVDNHGDSAAAREAMVALPYSYEQLQRPGNALAAYHSAEQHYHAVLTELEQLQNSIASTEFAAADGVAQRYGWLQLAEAPPLVQDNRRYLRPILQSDKFQLRLSELRDLRQLSQVIEAWQEKLPHFAHLIDARAQRHQTIVENYHSAQFDQQMQIAEQQYHQLDEFLGRIEKDRDGLALLAAQESEDSEMLSLLRRAEENYKVLEKAGRARESQGKTLARARGILLWQASEDYHHNLWQQRKQLLKLDEQLHQAERQRRNTDLVARRAPQLNRLHAQVSEAGPQLSAQRAAITRAADLIEASIRKDVIAELQRERSQVQQYMAHSRLAIARLQDAAMQAGPAAETQEGGEDE